MCSYSLLRPGREIFLAGYSVIDRREYFDNVLASEHLSVLDRRRLKHLLQVTIRDMQIPSNDFAARMIGCLKGMVLEEILDKVDAAVGK
jgi:hypothetical protein